MSWLTPEEFADHEAAKDRAARDAYTWQDASKDLAYLTSLTLMEAAGVVEEIRPTGVHPHDALPYLRAIFNAAGIGSSQRVQDAQRSRDIALSLACLITMGKELRS